MHQVLMKKKELQCNDFNDVLALKFREKKWFTFVIVVLFFFKFMQNKLICVTNDSYQVKSWKKKIMSCLIPWYTFNTPNIKGYTIKKIKNEIIFRNEN